MIKPYDLYPNGIISGALLATKDVLGAAKPKLCKANDSCADEFIGSPNSERQRRALLLISRRDYLLFR